VYRSRRIIFFVLLSSALALLPGFASGQSKPSGTRARAPRKPQTTKTSKTRERQQAIALLEEVAQSSRDIEDPSVRSEILLECADALWSGDANAARRIFTRAWDAAIAADEAALLSEQESGRYGELPERFTRNRAEALTAIAKRDSRLAESFFAQLSKWLESHPGDSSNSNDQTGDVTKADISAVDEFELGGQRLGVAFSLLDDGAYTSAASFAAPNVKYGARGSFIEFLVALHSRAPAEAERIFLRLLEQVRAAPDSDANDVLILSTYTLTPELLVVVDLDGSLRFRALNFQRRAANGDAREVGPNVRTAFYSVAAGILLKPTRPVALGADGAPMPGISMAHYFAISRLLPFFERDAPQFGPSLRARREQLAGEITAARREALSSQSRTQRLTPENKSDPLEGLLSATDQLGSSPESELMRQSALVRGAFIAAQKKLWSRARELASKIEDLDARGRVLSVIAMYQVADLANAYAETDANDVEKATQFARDVDVSHAARALAYVRTAELSVRRGDVLRAGVLLTEALVFAERAEMGSEGRYLALLAVASIASSFENERAWAVLPMAVSAANDLKVSREVETISDEEHNSSGAIAASLAAMEYKALQDIFGPFRMTEVFDTMSRLNFTRALNEARLLKDPERRAFNLIAVARGAIEGRTPTKTKATAGY
jgi:hypothetical protein